MKATSDTVQLLEQIRGGDRAAVGALLARHRALLREYVDARLDVALRLRVDPSDIIQEAQLEITQRLDDFLLRNPMPFHVWIRQTAYQNLARLRRVHLQAEQRSRRREISLPDSVSLLLAGRLVRMGVQPLEELVRRELAQRVRQALSRLSETDREILLLRAYEGLENQDVALMLELKPENCSKRYTRALLKLRRELREDRGDES